MLATNDLHFTNSLQTRACPVACSSEECLWSVLLSNTISGVSPHESQDTIFLIGPQIFETNPSHFRQLDHNLLAAYMQAAFFNTACDRTVALNFLVKM